MCLKRMQLSLKNMVRGGGGMGEMNDKNEDKQYSASRVWFRKHTVLCNSVTWVHYINSNNTQNAQILLSSLLLCATLRYSICGCPFRCPLFRRTSELG